MKKLNFFSVIVLLVLGSPYRYVYSQTATLSFDKSEIGGNASEDLKIKLRVTSGNVRQFEIVLYENASLVFDKVTKNQTPIWLTNDPELFSKNIQGTALVVKDNEQMKIIFNESLRSGDVVDFSTKTFAEQSDQKKIEFFIRETNLSNPVKLNSNLKIRHQKKAE